MHQRGRSSNLPLILIYGTNWYAASMIGELIMYVPWYGVSPPTRGKEVKRFISTTGFHAEKNITSRGEKQLSRSSGVFTLSLGSLLHLHIVEAKQAIESFQGHSRLCRQSVRTSASEALS
mgnify:CR=1 FL=1